MNRFVASLFAFLALSLPAKAEPLNILTGADFPPWVDAQLDHGGAAVWLVKNALLAGGEEQVPAISIVPWNRALEQTRRGNSDGTFPWGFSEQHKEDFLLSDPFLPVASSIWTHRDDTYPIDGLKTLEGKVLCRPMGYTLAQSILDLAENGTMQIISPPSMTSCFQLLAIRRVDILFSVEQEATRAMQARDLAPETFRRAGILRDILGGERDGGLYFMIAKSHPRAEEIMSRFNAGLAKIRADGSLETIKALYAW